MGSISAQKEGSTCIEKGGITKRPLEAVEMTFMLWMYHRGTNQKVMMWTLDQLTSQLREKALVQLQV